MSNQVLTVVVPSSVGGWCNQMQQYLSMMATDERNFRSSYYEKVGFRSVEEKKSLEILLKDKPLDKLKLKQFCLRFTVPTIHRNLLWKIILDVIPVFMDSHVFVMEQREVQYNDLLHALKVMRIVDGNTSKPRLFLAMWLLETNRLYFDFNIQKDNSLVKICETLLQVFDSDPEVYWVAKGFFQFSEQVQQDLPRLYDGAINLIEREDITLYKHLQTIIALNGLPISDWLKCCFAGVLNECALVKIWDKICGGSNKILIYVVVVMFTTLRRVILRCSDLNGVLKCLQNITEETSEVVANKAIELWQQNGGHTENNHTHPAIKPKPN